MNFTYASNKIDSIRPGISDLWNAWMLKEATFSKHDIPLCQTTAKETPKNLVSFGEAKQSMRNIKKLEISVIMFMHSSTSMNMIRHLMEKISTRTATRDEYYQYTWNKRFTKRRQAGIDNFWRQERKRLLTGKTPTRQWTSEQKKAILRNECPKISGRSFQSHHTYSASKFPHLSNRGEIIYPATFSEHLYDWHGGNFKNSLPGKPINKHNYYKRRRKK